MFYLSKQLQSRLEKIKDDGTRMLVEQIVSFLWNNIGRKARVVTIANGKDVLMKQYEKFTFTLADNNITLMELALDSSEDDETHIDVNNIYNVDCSSERIHIDLFDKRYVFIEFIAER